MLKIVFHSTLQENVDSVNTAILERIDLDFSCTSDPEHEVKSRWYPISLTLGYDAVIEPAHDWVSSIGRIKFLRPVYNALVNSHPQLAVAWYNENKDFYHPIASKIIKSMVKPILEQRSEL